MDGRRREFYLRYYNGHGGKFGHEFVEFEFRPNGKLRYVNCSKYRGDGEIRKEVYVSPLVLRQVEKMVSASSILQEADDALWPPPDRSGKEELEIFSGRYHVSLACSKIGSLSRIQRSRDPEGLRMFYFLVQDIKALVLTLINAHYKKTPV